MSFGLFLPVFRFCLQILHFVPRFYVFFLFLVCCFMEKLHCLLLFFEKIFVLCKYAVIFVLGFGLYKK